MRTLKGPIKRKQDSKVVEDDGRFGQTGQDIEGREEVAEGKRVEEGGEMEGMVGGAQKRKVVN